MQHLESLVQTDSQSLKRAELKGYAKKWMNAKYPIHLAIYLDVLTPLKVLSLGFQKEIHDPVTAVQHITEFNWTMAKLRLLIDLFLEDNATRLTHFTKFLKEKSINKNSEYVYQDVILKNFASARESVTRSYEEIITRLALPMQERFQDFEKSPVFTSLVPILDFNLWPKEQESLGSYCDEEILKLSNHFEALLQLNQCVVISIPNEWDVLKAYVLPMLTSIDSIDYLQTWLKLFKNKDVMSSCSNVLRITEPLLIMPFSNAKLERMFSQMN